MPSATSAPPRPPPVEPAPLQVLFRSTAHRQNVCVLALLTWVASCDGAIADDELELLRGVAAGVPGGEMLPGVIEVARLGRPEDLELACRHLRHNADRGDRALLAQLFVAMAVQDGHLTVAENHVLRLLADVLNLSARRFAKLFEEVTHRPFPEVGDPSSLQWWHQREAGQQAAPPAGGWGRGGLSAGATVVAIESFEMSRETALRVLGLTEGTSPDAVHAAYRRMAKARHPDRFARLGPAAQATATAAFKRLQEAYDVLSKPAATRIEQGR